MVDNRPSLGLLVSELGSALLAVSMFLPKGPCRRRLLTEEATWRRLGAAERRSSPTVTGGQVQKQLELCAGVPGHLDGPGERDLRTLARVRLTRDGSGSPLRQRLSEGARQPRASQKGGSVTNQERAALRVSDHARKDRT